jgi:hypothetical protein
VIAGTYDDFEPRLKSTRENIYHSGPREKTQRTRRLPGKIRSLPLAEIGDFFVQMGEGSLEGLAMVGMSGGREVVGDTDAR